MVNGILDQFGIQAVDFMVSGSLILGSGVSYIWKNLMDNDYCPRFSIKPLQPTTCMKLQK